jgi:hypothetical protein
MCFGTDLNRVSNHSSASEAELNRTTPVSIQPIIIPANRAAENPASQLCEMPPQRVNIDPARAVFARHDCKPRFAQGGDP